jgi:hypothetical protein
LSRVSPNESIGNSNLEDLPKIKTQMSDTVSKLISNPAQLVAE